MPETNPTVKFYSLYWDNVNPQLVKVQKDIFDYFSININQQQLDKQPHGLWIDNLLMQAEDEDIIVIVDIDCFPLNKEIIHKSISVAEQGGIFGCAQAANHLEPDFIYAAPMYLSIKARTWRSIGSPSFKEKDIYDVGGYVTFLAQQNNIPIHLIYPNVSAINKWLLSDIGFYGIFTIYDHSILHLFESRQACLPNTLSSLRNNLIENYNNFDYKKFVIQAANEYCKEIANGNVPAYKKKKKKNIFKKLKEYIVKK